MSVLARVSALLPLLTAVNSVSLLAAALAILATFVLRNRSSSSSSSSNNNNNNNNNCASDEKNAIAAAFTGLVDSFKKSASPRALPRANYGDKVVLVTGANTGLGFGIARRLAELNCAVVVACRTDAEKTAQDLRAATGNQNVTSMYVNLGDARSVHALVDALISQRRVIDCAVLNAAVLTTSSEKKSDQDLDQQYAVNAVANAILIERLSKAAKVARFVLVSSEAHRWAKPSEIDATLDGLKHPPPYTTANAFDQYSRSKLLVMTWLCGAARQFQRDSSLRRVQLAAMCPGAIASNIARNTPYVASVVTFFMKIFFPSPYKAAAPVVWMALADDISAPPGQPIYYQHLWQAKAPSANAMDEEKSSRVYADMNAVIKKL